MFQNLSNPDFLLGLEQSKKETAAKYKQLYIKNRQLFWDATSTEDRKKFDKLKEFASARHRQVTNELNDIRVQFVCRFFKESDYGVIILDSDKDIYKRIPKYSSAVMIDGWLFDYAHNSSTLSTGNHYRKMTANEYLDLVLESNNRRSDENTKVMEKLVIKAKAEIKNRLVKHQGVCTWEKPSGISPINPKMLWLFAGKSNLPKIKGVSTKDGFVRKFEDWMGVLFILNKSRGNHNVPRNWVLGTNGVVYPFAYAKKKNICVYLRIGNSMAYVPHGKIRDLDLVYSHRYGHYDKSKYCVHDGNLCCIDDFVNLHCGSRCHKSKARFVARHNAYYYHHSCIQTSDGTFELSHECVEISGEYLHHSNKNVEKCNLCGHVHHISNFVLIDSSDDTSPLICKSCANHVQREVNRMCYSTDVLNHKGFGNTDMKINNEPVYVGLELECYADYNDNSKKAVVLGINKYTAGKQNYTVATRDSSLDGEHGVEYIFRPEGLNHQKRNVKHFIENVGEYLAKDAGDGYGLHIHVSSHFLTKMDKIRIDNFVSVFEKYFRAIGGRSQTEYQIKKELRNNSQLKTMAGDKYKMVNIGRSGTIEYRFPKSLVDEVHISLNLEMALATTMFCKYQLSNIKLDIKNITAEPLKAFIDYISSNKKLYPLLNAENNANIKLDKLESYSTHIKKVKRVTVDRGVFDSASEDETYALSA